MTTQTLWHTLTSEEVLQQLGVTPGQGLAAATAKERLRQFGLNTLQERGGRSAWSILWEQVTSTMALILAAAALLSGLVGSFKDSVTILAIVALFALLGFVQDYRAERAMAALKRLAVPLVRVRRDGQVLELPAMELVPGDIVLLEAGSVVPADCRLYEAHALRVQESLLTGESEAVEKQTDPLMEPDLPAGDRRNLLYMGTLLAAGRAEAVVTTTGMATELGRIATLLQQVGQEWTPLQKRLDRLGKVLALVAVVVAAVIFGVGLLRGEGIREMLMLAVSVAVAAIPEGLPAVVTITLALGAQRMLQRRALIRRLPAVETLGSVTVICSDKTGTLTENRMTVTELVSAAEAVRGNATATTEQAQLLLALGTLCNDAQLTFGSDGRQEVLGDPTEGALVVAAAKSGLLRQQLELALPRIAEIPFDSVSKRMITVHRLSEGAGAYLPTLPLVAGGRLLAAKGAIDSMLPLCTDLLLDGMTPISEQHRQALQQVADRYADQGQRVLALAVRLMQPGDDDRLEALQQHFCLVGLSVMSDPPRRRRRMRWRTACRLVFDR